MKSVQTFLSLTLIMSLFSCTKNEDGCDLIPAKILRYDCDRVIMQLQTSEQIGDASWTDVQTGTTYNNVVSYYNTCQIGALTSGGQSTLYVTLEKTDANTVAQNCVQCQAVSQNPPQTKVQLIKIEKENCSGRGN